MSNLTTYQFAVNLVEVAPYNNGAAVTTWTTIPIVAEGMVEYKMGEAEVTDGEGALQHTFYHSQRLTVSVRMKRWAFHALELITGSGVSSMSGTDMIFIGTGAELVPPPVRLRLQCKAVDGTNTSTSGYFEVLVLKALGKMPAVSMKETSAGEYTIEFKGVVCTADEAGNAIPPALARVRALKTTTA